MIDLLTKENFEACDIAAGKARVAYMIAQGYDGKTNINERTGKPYPLYACETVFGTPENPPYHMNPEGHPYLTEEFFAGFKHEVVK